MTRIRACGAGRTAGRSVNHSSARDRAWGSVATVHASGDCLFMIAMVRIALSRPYTFVVLALLLLIVGPLAALRTPTDIFPEIRIPVIGVIWGYTGLPPDQKRAAAARFRSGEPVVVVATIAFGMGIDRPDVRFVAHLDMPDSPEAFYQQIGRAGRDGEPAETRMLYGGEDIARARYHLQASPAPEAQKQVMRGRLESMIGLAETAECRTRGLLACFGEVFPQDCGHCDICEAPPVAFDGTIEAQKLLSAVFRTGQRFGAGHVISVLLGKATEPVVRWEHDRLPTFGVGADRAETFWRSVIRQLIARGALEMEMGDYPILKLDSDRARPILRGEERVMLITTSGLRDFILTIWESTLSSITIIEALLPSASRKPYGKDYQPGFSE
eukprot:gene40936-55329_t